MKDRRAQVVRSRRVPNKTAISAVECPSEVAFLLRFLPEWTVALLSPLKK